ncbi:MAG: PCRF domain-containing protein [Candidatus Paceibacterota bacterium]|jgi:peptide chain release factor 1|nr:PCRF domain-containing protein [Candidatus Paceibacterota bacterium]
MQEETKTINAIILEIRAGVGGEEAALFASDLLRMYTRYSQNQGWSVTVLHSNPTELGGIKEVILEIKGAQAYDSLKYEGGVHRIQRIPRTEKSGRIHTSTATVAVLAKPDMAQMNIRPQDIRVDYYKASGPGGQYVNKRMSAVRLTHIPTGVVVCSQTERSLNQNKESAMSLLQARILEKQEKEAGAEFGDARKDQIGTGSREEKIRTYNFPQDRITDHRINKSFHDIEKIMEGKMEKIVKTMRKSGI